MSKSHEEAKSREGPWPFVRTDGDLDRSLREWLHTNGAGAYSMSTLAVMHTRREHGMFVAATAPPLGRHVILSHAETVVEADGRTYRLATHQFPGIAPTPGYRLLQAFAQDPIPRWIYRLGRHDFERTLTLVRGLNAVVIGYTWRGLMRARLTMKPLMPLRASTELQREHGGMMQRVTLRSGSVEIQPVPHLPPINFAHDGVFMGSPDWWRRFEYPDDRERGVAYQEDMWTPGVFELALEPGRTSYLVVSVGPLPTRPAAELVKETADFLRGQDPGADRSATVRVLSIAVEQFCVDASPRPALLAGYPHHGLHVRDLLIALPGSLLVRGRIETAQRALRTVLSKQHGGLLPAYVPETVTGRPLRSPDTTLWLFEVARELVDQTGTNDEFVRRELYPVLRRAFVRLRAKRRASAWVTPDGLLANGANGQALTWMDARARGAPVTPRRGLAIELQALWSKGCETLARLARVYGDELTARAAESACAAARAAFRARFWCNETYYPYDCIIDERDRAGAGAWADAAVRPNALIALALDPELFEDWQAAAIVERVRHDLLTPRGIRTLSPNERGYHGQCAGTHDEREQALHQGSAWPYLLGTFVRAALRLAPDDAELHRELVSRVEQAAADGLALGHVVQVADGDAPHRGRGCPAQAWSVAELLRALVTDLGA